MTQILWHGRGGQGAFTAAKLLGAAYSLRDDNSYALAFPSFGPERRGAPIRAFTKLDDRPIGDRSEITTADYIIILDDTLFSEKDFNELKPGGKILINTKKVFTDQRIIAFDGDSIAISILKQPISNTVMLGVLATVFREITIQNILTAIELYMPGKIVEKNKNVILAVEKVIGLEGIN